VTDCHKVSNICTEASAHPKLSPRKAQTFMHSVNCSLLTMLSHDHVAPFALSLDKTSGVSPVETVTLVKHDRGSRDGCVEPLLKSPLLCQKV